MKFTGNTFNPTRRATSAEKLTQSRLRTMYSSALYFFWISWAAAYIAASGMSKVIP